MKKISGILFLFAMAVLTACEGPVGPPGPEGPPGEDGTNLLGTIFEIEGDFTADNDYMLFYEFPDDFEIYDTDVVLVYILWDQTDNETDIWRLLPQTVVVEETPDSKGGVIQYNFDYTAADVQVFLEFTVDELLPAETDNQVFRIAVLPADFAKNNKSVDISDLNAVMKSLQINPSAIKKATVK